MYLYLSLLLKQEPMAISLSFSLSPLYEVPHIHPPLHPHPPPPPPQI